VGDPKGSSFWPCCSKPHTTADGAERAKIRELIAAGLQLHHITARTAHEKSVTKLGNDGVAFVGSCESNPAHTTLTGGI
jgi:hypothetical protein